MLSDKQVTEMAFAVSAMKMTSRSSPENPPPSLAASPDCQPSSTNSPPPHATEIATTASSLAPPTNPPSPQIELVQVAQQFLDILKSLSAAQSPSPPPAAADVVKSEERPARASKLDFKTVNEVFVFHIQDLFNS
jgi:hypothetical protein